MKIRKIGLDLVLKRSNLNFNDKTLNCHIIAKLLVLTQSSSQLSVAVSPHGRQLKRVKRPMLCIKMKIQNQRKMQWNQTLCNGRPH